MKKIGLLKTSFESPLSLALIMLAAFLLFLSTPSILTGQDCDNLSEESVKNNIVLVIDKSGSMSGSAFASAQSAAQNFIGSMKRNDRAAVVAFSDNVAIESTFTSNTGRLQGAIGRLEAGGGTRLYDAVARAGQMLSRQTGVKVIVYLTDGKDNQSKFSLREIRELNIGEGVFVYGIGLGNVNHSALRRLSRVTDGEYSQADDHTRLTGIYSQVLSTHYTASEEIYSESGRFLVTSIPSSRPVKIDGSRVGTTPLKVEKVAPGSHNVEVVFPSGIWQCEAPSKAGYRNEITARASEMPTDLWVESAPTNAAVYLDGSYVGSTSKAPSREGEDGRDYSNQLKIPSVPPGRHTLRLIAVPNMDFSPSQVFEFDFTMRDSPRYVKALIFMQQAKWGDGENTEKTKDPSKMMEEFKDKNFDEEGFGGNDFGSDGFGGDSPF